MGIAVLVPRVPVTHIFPESLFPSEQSRGSCPEQFLSRGLRCSCPVRSYSSCTGGHTVPVPGVTQFLYRGSHSSCPGGHTVPVPGVTRFLSRGSHCSCPGGHTVPVPGVTRFLSRGSHGSCPGGHTVPVPGVTLFLSWGHTVPVAGVTRFLSRGCAVPGSEPGTTTGHGSWIRVLRRLRLAPVSLL